MQICLLTSIVLGKIMEREIRLQSTQLLETSRGTVECYMTLHMQITIRKAVVFLIDLLVIALARTSKSSCSFCQECLLVGLPFVVVSLIPIRQLLHYSGRYERYIDEQQDS